MNLGTLLEIGAKRVIEERMRIREQQSHEKKIRLAEQVEEVPCFNEDFQKDVDDFNDYESQNQSFSSEVEEYRSEKEFI